MSSQPPPELPDAADVVVSAAASLVNLAGIRLTEAEQRNPSKAKEAIDAARELLPLCPEEAVGPIRDALSQVQMLYVREMQTGAHSAEPSASATTQTQTQTQTGTEPDAADSEERAKARAKIWTPPGA